MRLATLRSITRRAAPVAASLATLAFASDALASYSAPNVYPSTTTPYVVDLVVNGGGQPTNDPTKNGDYYHLEAMRPGQSYVYTEDYSTNGADGANFHLASISNANTTVYYRVQKRWSSWDFSSDHFTDFTPWQSANTLVRTDGTMRPAGEAPQFPSQTYACLDVASGTASASQLDLIACSTGGARIHWGLGPYQDLVSGLASNLVMDVSGGSTAPGAPVIAYPRNLGTNQKWRFDSVDILGLGDQCLDVSDSNGDAGAGSYVGIWNCKNGANQKWTLDDGTKLIHGFQGLCLQAEDNAQIKVQNCDGSYRQQWNVVPGGALQSVQTGKCLDVTGGWNANNGAALQVYDCNGGANQKWALRGHVVNGLGQCLDVLGANYSTGLQNIATWPCQTNDPAEVWYFSP